MEAARGNVEATLSRFEPLGAGVVVALEATKSRSYVGPFLPTKTLSFPTKAQRFQKLGLRGSGSLLIQGRFGLRNETFQRLWIVDGEVGEDLAIKLDLSGFETFDEAGVGKILGADGSGDPLDPETTELALTLFAVAILILPGLVDCVFGVAVELGTEAAEAFGALEDALPAFAAGGTICCSWHCLVSGEQIVGFHLDLRQSHSLSGSPWRGTGCLELGPTSGPGISRFVQKRSSGTNDQEAKNGVVSEAEGSA